MQTRPLTWYRALDDDHKLRLSASLIGVFLLLVAAGFVTFAVHDINAHGGVTGAKGRVVARQIVPAHTVAATVDMFGGAPAYHVPTRYMLEVRSTDNETQDWVWVSAHRYARFPIGSFYQGPLVAVSDSKPLD
jgi:hypothetical protein